MKLITKEIETAINETPYGSTDSVPAEEKKVIARFFNPTGAGTWYVLEDSMYDDGKIVFGAASLGYGLELGDFSISELEQFRGLLGLGMERDLAVEPKKKTLGELMKIYGETMMY